MWSTSVVNKTLSSDSDHKVASRNSISDDTFIVSCKYQYNRKVEEFFFLDYQVLLRHSAAFFFLLLEDHTLKIPGCFFNLSKTIPDCSLCSRVCDMPESLAIQSVS